MFSFFHFPYIIFFSLTASVTSSFHHHVSLCLHGHVHTCPELFPTLYLSSVASDHLHTGLSILFPLPCLRLCICTPHVFSSLRGNAISILLISNHNSFRVLFAKIASVRRIFYLENICIFSTGNGQPRDQNCANCIGTLSFPLKCVRYALSGFVCHLYSMSLLTLSFEQVNWGEPPPGYASSLEGPEIT